jgi:hypothetical protein
MFVCKAGEWASNIRYVTQAPVTQEMWEQRLAQAQHYHYMQSMGGKKGSGGKRGKNAAQGDQPPPPPLPPGTMWPYPHLDPNNPEGAQAAQAWSRAHAKQAQNGQDATAANAEEGQQGDSAEAQAGQGQGAPPPPSAAQKPRKRARDSQPPPGHPYMHPSAYAAFSAAAWANFHPSDEGGHPAATNRPPTLKEICQERYGPEAILSPGNQALPSSNGIGAVEGASSNSSPQKQPHPDVPPSDDLPAHESVDML